MKFEKKKLQFSEDVNQILKLLNQQKLNTVCQQAKCPNMAECFKKHTATFLLMGPVCTRNCTFCSVPKNQPAYPLDLQEPHRVARTVKQLGLDYVVLTSVTRDDLDDEGIGHFIATIHAIHHMNDRIKIEILTPDFKKNHHHLENLIHSPIAVFNHNLETVADLYPQVRPQANYQTSLNLLKIVKQSRPEIKTKSGIMVGLGETQTQMQQLFEDLANVQCDILTIGQYFPPSKQSLHLVDVKETAFFEEIKKVAHRAGIPTVFAGTYVRSSYHAKEVFNQPGVC